jgi:hypothetical protein
MKSKQHLSYLSVGLSTLLVLGNSVPVFGAMTSNHNNTTTANNLFSLERLQAQTLLAQGNFDFSGQYGSAPDRRATGFRRGGCLAAGQQMIPILPNQDDTVLNSTPVDLEEQPELNLETEEQLESNGETMESSFVSEPENDLEKINLKQNLENEGTETTKTDIVEMSEEDMENMETSEMEVTEEIEETPDKVWFTADEYPSVYFYLPENWANKAEFVLYNDQDEVIYSAAMTLPGEATQEEPREGGVIEVNFKDQQDKIEPLVAGNTYLWEVQVLCDEINRSGNPTVNGWIQLIDEDTAEMLNEDLEEVTDPSAKNEVYGKNGIWYSLVSNIYETSNLDDWTTLLEEVGSPEVMDSPMLGSAIIDETYEGDFPPL